MEIADIQFLEEHINNWHTIQNGYMRNIDMSILKNYEAIYRKYIDPQYICTMWCGNCKMEMIKMIYTKLENNG